MPIFIEIPILSVCYDAISNKLKNILSNLQSIMNKLDKLIKNRHFFLFAGILLIAVNLRPAITSVSPLSKIIQNHLHLSNFKIGLLTTLPLLAFAAFSPFVSKLSRILGTRKCLMAGLIVLFLGFLLRYSNYLPQLYLGTLIIGAGLAILNVILPSLIKADFPHQIGLVTGIYGTVMAAFAGIASGCSIPLSENFGIGWKNALLIWIIPVIIAILLWLFLLKGNTHRKEKITTIKPTDANERPIWKSSKAWTISLFMGMQSFIFYCIVAWLPAILISKGMNQDIAGWMLLFVQIMGLPSTLLLPIITSRTSRKSLVMLFVASLNLIGFLALIFLHSTIFLIIGTAFFGISTGSISLCLMTISIKAKEPQRAAELSGMAQSIGYLLASTGPALLGYTFDKTNSWLYPIGIILLANLIFFFSGWKAIK